MKKVFQTNLFALIFFVGYLVVSNILSILIYLLLPDQYTVVSTILIYFIIFGGGIALYLLHTGQSFKETLGLRKVRLRVLIYAAILGLTIQPCMMLISYVSQFFFHNFIDTAVNEMLSLPLGTLMLILAVLPAVFEEALCRGVFLNGYKEYPLWVGVVFCGLFFAILHGNIQQALYAFAGGVLLSLIARGANSVIPSIITHFVLNGTQALSAWASADAAVTEEAASFSWEVLALFGELTLAFLPLSLYLIYLIFKASGQLPSQKTEPEEPVRSFPPLRALWPIAVLFVLFVGLGIFNEVLAGLV